MVYLKWLLENDPSAFRPAPVWHDNFVEESDEDILAQLAGGANVFDNFSATYSDVQSQDDAEQHEENNESSDFNYETFKDSENSSDWDSSPNEHDSPQWGYAEDEPEEPFSVKTEEPELLDKDFDFDALAKLMQPEEPEPEIYFTETADSVVGMTYYLAKNAPTEILEKITASESTNTVILDSDIQSGCSNTIVPFTPPELSISDTTIIPRKKSTRKKTI